jgi:hypothetical protein
MPYVPMVFILVAYVCIIYIAWNDTNEVIKKDCTIAEISPDFTVKEKELCRELRGKK